MGKFIDNLFDENGSINLKKVQSGYDIAIMNFEAGIVKNIYEKTKILPDNLNLEKIKLKSEHRKEFIELYSYFNSLIR